MLYFREEVDARQFAEKQDHYEYIDFGPDAEDGHQYAVRVIPGDTE